MQSTIHATAHPTSPLPTVSPLKAWLIRIKLSCESIIGELLWWSAKKN